MIQRCSQSFHEQTLHHHELMGIPGCLQLLKRKEHWVDRVLYGVGGKHVAQHWLTNEQETEWAQIGIFLIGLIWTQ